MAAQVQLTADVMRDPSSACWRVNAFDVARGHMYLTGANDMNDALLNIQRLVMIQYFPDSVHIIGKINRVDI